MFDEDEEDIDYEAWVTAMEHHYEYLRECMMLDRMEKEMAEEVQQKIIIGGE